MGADPPAWPWPIGRKNALLRISVTWLHGTYLLRPQGSAGTGARRYTSLNDHVEAISVSWAPLMAGRVLALPFPIEQGQKVAKKLYY